MTQDNHRHNHDHGGHNYNHDHERCSHDNHEHPHGHNHSKDAHKQDRNNTDKKRFMVKTENIPGLIRIEQHIHDEAIVISGTLTVISGIDSVYEIISSELETASSLFTQKEGIVGHIKAAVSTTKTGMISITENKAMIKEGQDTRVQISLVAIVFIIDPEEGEEIVRKTLSQIRKRLSG